LAQTVAIVAHSFVRRPFSACSTPRPLRPVLQTGMGRMRESLIPQGRAGGAGGTGQAGPNRRGRGSGGHGGLAGAVPRPAAPDYATKVGEQRQVRLADGSLAALNTDSQLDVAYSTGRRDLTLRQGEAWFQVAITRRGLSRCMSGRSMSGRQARPFRCAGPTRVWVVVTEGRVLAWVDGAGRQPVAIARGDGPC
jgi:transmembrane sensor